MEYTYYKVWLRNKENKHRNYSSNNYHQTEDSRNEVWIVHTCLPRCLPRKVGVERKDWRHTGSNRDLPNTNEYPWRMCICYRLNIEFIIFSCVRIVPDNHVNGVRLSYWRCQKDYKNSSYTNTTWKSWLSDKEDNYKRTCEFPSQHVKEKKPPWRFTARKIQSWA